MESENLQCRKKKCDMNEANGRKLQVKKTKQTLTLEGDAT